MRLKGTIWLREIVDKLAFKQALRLTRSKRYSTTNQRSASLKEGSAREKMFTRLQARLMLGDTYL